MKRIIAICIAGSIGMFAASASALTVSKSPYQIEQDYNSPKIEKSLVASAGFVITPQVFMLGESAETPVSVVVRHVFVRTLGRKVYAPLKSVSADRRRVAVRRWKNHYCRHYYKPDRPELFSV